VTASALYGREINLYWDARFIPDVVAVVTRVAPLWLIALTVAGLVVTLTIVALSVRWALRQAAGAMVNRRVRIALMGGAAVMVVLFVMQRASERIPFRALFAAPAAQALTRQVQLITEALANVRTLPAGPAVDSDLSVVKGADVLLVFVEAYGAVSYERPEFARHLAPSRTRLESDILDTNRRVVSAFVTSPTFGGSSWLAHISLLTGIEIRDADANARLMSESRPTLVDAFKRHGYRTVALMPGLQKLWPEGRFYKFDEIYGAARLNYPGPYFGWFNVPDQISMERVDTVELRRTARPPLFLFFPTISTHFPFRPTPPYQADWRRVGGPVPFDDAAVDAAYLVQPQWDDWAPGYVDALSYEFQVLGGFLRDHAEGDLVMILIGDHQPAAAVSGEGMPWEVPVHVITSRRQLLERLIARGFRSGLTPERPPLGAMHTLLPVLLEAFGDRARTSE
jgi:sulfatase-like protein